ncbi:bifunctional 3-(3-hydroxy-phenyl)propionate/3-hydroxycinnamic acid hydroxylase [Nakamurella sp. A5-74]|uniref:Bifunctional 3-(3-hydroxy-phenyl)propionate/3-hydroxycinnamic acid hydroxylase n=1 Tax=Nakamurella sp. A5-74 TaxID=3158264 RepID=A0AAU8DQW0_9ACTN
MTETQAAAPAREPGRALGCQVLVVGAGPVGMTAAALLAARGVDVLVVERNSDTSGDPKAISLDDESLRTFQQAGLERDILSVIVPGTGTAYFDADNHLLFRGRAAVPDRLGYPFKNPFAQPDLEQVLRRALERHPRVRLLFSTTMTALTQTIDEVRVTVSADGDEHTIQAAYVLGADGGRSAVRSAIGISMHGRSYDDVWLVADTLGDTHTQRYGMHHGDPDRPHVIVPGLGGRCRYEFLLLPGECPAGEDPPFELLELLLAPYRSIRPDQVERAVTYRFHGLSADAWRRGRAFLIGDAAHMMPPFAGQGLNTGIRDAANLAWKITEALAHGGGEQLLDSYEQERKPHAAAVIRSSERLGRVVMTRSTRLASFRDQSVRRALATPQGRAFFEEMRWRPAAELRTGLVHEFGSHLLVGRQLGQPKVFSLNDHRQVLLDQVTGDGWAVIGVGTAPQVWPAVADAFDGLDPVLVHVPLDDTVVDCGPDVRVAIDIDTRLYGELQSARDCFVLLRPDHFVAAVIRPADITAVGARAVAWVRARHALVPQ